MVLRILKGLILIVILAIVPSLSTAAMLFEMAVTDSGTGGAPGTAPVNDGVYFTLGYGFNSFTGGSQPLGLDWDYFIGSEKKWSIGETGVFDFNTANSSDFDVVAGLLANGIEEDLSRGVLAINTDGSFYPGHVGTGPDSFYITNPIDSIDLIRLIVQENSLSFSQYDTGFSHDRSFSVTWQVHGEMAPVPEPATMLLLCTGLVGIAGLGRKKIFNK